MVKEFELTRDQKNVLSKAVKWYRAEVSTQVYIIAGSAGTGKTTILKMISEELGITDNTMFVTFTGKASLVLKSKGIKNYSTIHKLIYNVDIKSDGSVSFYPKSKDELSSLKLIIVDESSMVSKELLTDLLSFGIKVIFVGDKNQLPPIGETKSLFDKPNVEMKEITRQSKDSPIIYLSQRVIHNKELKYGKYGKYVKLVKNLNNDNVLLKADQILVSTNKARNYLNQKIRHLKGIKTIHPVKGDKVICKKNSWGVFLPKNQLFLLNGIIGNIDSDPIENELQYFDNSINRVRFDSTYKFDMSPIGYSDEVFKNLTASYDALLTGSTEYKAIYNNKVEMMNYAYSITIHSSQGSEWGKLLVYADNLWGNTEMKNKLLYTALTRSKKSLIMVI
jgi:ATP-dependent exoDNAse (exonuclease V) alpha subunit